MNGWKLPKIAGNGCAEVAARRSRERTDGGGEFGMRGKGIGPTVPLRQSREPTPVAEYYCTDVRSMNASVMDGCVEQ